jgi:hypothetical protein
LILTAAFGEPKPKAPKGRGPAAAPPDRGPGFNQRANFVQANPNKTKQKSLDFLGFIRPNRDFSMGYEQKNKKNRLAYQVVCKTSQAHLSLVSPSAGARLARRGSSRRLRKA